MSAKHVFLFMASALLACACGNSSQMAVNVETPPPSSAAISAVDPNHVNDAASGIDCTELGLDGHPAIIGQFPLTITDQQFQVATVSCVDDNYNYSAEVVESFVLDNGVWASNGLVSGPDLGFHLSANKTCTETATIISCPVDITGEDSTIVHGDIVITGQDGQPVWTFEPEY